MFGTDEFGNTRLLPIVFAVVFVVLSVGTIATSQTIWEAPVGAPVRLAY